MLVFVLVGLAAVAYISHENAVAAQAQSHAQPRPRPTFFAPPQAAPPVTNQAPMRSDGITLGDVKTAVGIGRDIFDVGKDIYHELFDAGSVERNGSGLASSDFVGEDVSGFSGDDFESFV